ncbi:MAG: helix-turn-helix transcriptional regulator, partial [Eggerthellaceae bacterium]|nr:helix-turn-helix transcriptional regulator [Eggerthellaceae bacterium]
GSLAGAFACLLFSFASIPETMLLMRVFPVASAAWIDPFQPMQKHGSVTASGTDRTEVLSWKILCGTLCFGMAAGFLETFATQPGGPANDACQVGMLLFGAFLIGALSLLLSDGFGKGDALNKTYRLAVFVMMLGILVIPSGVSAMLPGKSMMLAGYLGLEAVLISLFLVMAKISESDGVAAFTRGFMALFAGEAVGVICSNLLSAVAGFEQTPYAAVVLAGVLALLSYVFLFTERDFDDLSQIATDKDAFDAVCDVIVQEYSLSKREAEILPYALRGRTASRIAEELTISKSTVDTHLRRINGKVGVHGRQELIDLSEGLRSKL